MSSQAEYEGEVKVKKSITYLFILFFTVFLLINCWPALIGSVTYKVAKTAGAKTTHERQEFLTKFHQTNLEREKAGLLPLDLCIAKYQFDTGWAKKDAGCREKIATYLRGEMDEFGQYNTNAFFEEQQLAPYSQEPQENKVRVIYEGAVLRLKPNSTSPVIKNLPIGATLDVIESIGEWVRVQLPPDKKGMVIEGYVHRSFIRWE